MAVLVACMPGFLCALYYLSTVPDVTWQRGQQGLTIDRVWMARARRSPVGIGYESQRVTRAIADDKVCVTNTIHYFLWSDAGEAADGANYSRLFAKTDYGWQATGETCE